MAKNTKPALDPVRAKAAQMRQAQERADRRVRIIVIACVAAIVLAVVGAVGAVIWNQQAQINAARNVDPSKVLGSYADGRPIILNGNGIVAEADPNLPTLTEYFDYSCHACADLDVAMGQDLTTWASQGHYNLEIQPVITVNMDYLKPAAGASLVVAQKAPDKWVEFHHALLAYFRTQFQASNGKVVQNLDASWKQVKEIAAEVGVPASVINTFPVNAVESYLETSTNAWRDAGYSGRESGLGTPELVKNRSTVIPLGGQLGALRQSIMQEYGITDSASQSSGQDGASDAAEPSQSGDVESQSSGTTSSSD